MKIVSKKGLLALSLGVVLAVGVRGAEVQAQQANGLNQIRVMNICMNARNGRITARRRCLRGREQVIDAQALSMLTTGGAGEQGARGERGPVGPQGPQGMRGQAGPVGPQGATGPRGERGATGAQGARGQQGAQGQQGVQGPQGVPGPRGETGPRGAVGPQGLSGVSGYEVVSDSIRIGAGLFAQNAVLCPVGKVAVGGGALSRSAIQNSGIIASSPFVNSEGRMGWVMRAVNSSGVNVWFDFHVICINAL